MLQLECYFVLDLLIKAFDTGDPIGALKARTLILTVVLISITTRTLLLP